MGVAKVFYKKEVSRYESQVTNRCGVSSVVIN